MVFIGLDGHHNTGPGAAVGGVWLNDPANKAKLFAKTALIDQLRAPVDDPDLRASALHQPAMCSCGRTCTWRSSGMRADRRGRS